MGGKGQHIDVLRDHINRQMPGRLHRVGMEGYALRPAYLPDFRNGLDGTDLVVGVHNGNKAGVLPDGICHLGRKYPSVFMNIQQLDLKAGLFQFF